MPPLYAILSRHAIMLPPFYTLRYLPPLRCLFFVAIAFFISSTAYFAIAAFVITPLTYTPLSA